MGNELQSCNIQTNEEHLVEFKAPKREQRVIVQPPPRKPVERVKEPEHRPQNSIATEQPSMNHLTPQAQDTKDSLEPIQLPYNSKNSENPRYGPYRYLQNDATYQGQYWYGEMTGEGYIVSAEGEGYEGEFANDVPNGFGRQYYTNGDYYEGDFREGLPHGQGKLVYKEEDIVYTGDMRYGKKDGRGKIIYKDGSRYEGEFRDDFKEGTGMFFFKDGSTYEGQFLNDDANGQGKIEVLECFRDI
jgi:hypothetical protein